MGDDNGNCEGGSRKSALLDKMGVSVYKGLIQFHLERYVK